MNWQDTILSLDDNAIKIILQEISFNTLAKALLESDEKTRGKFYKNLHTRHKAMLKEGIEYAENEGIKEAQEQVLSLLKNLAHYPIKDDSSPHGFDTDNDSDELDLDMENDTENTITNKQEAAEQLFLALREAAELGNAQACFNLGFYYYNGFATTFNSQTEENIIYNYYLDGEFVEKDHAKAAAYLHKAAEQGHARAQTLLGACYMNGEGVTKDRDKAVELYRKAAEQDCMEALFELGFCYEKGWGVEKDEAKAGEYYAKAAELGHTTARDFLTEYRRQLPDNKGAAQ